MIGEIHLKATFDHITIISYSQEYLSGI